ncbi:hypothetical protein TD95_004640 [Thielaviopsis punctulata]|uniref:SLC26A/SulP transporter domain-containing protein n=1 Tax=Thielaviopsis punctulata TaxID=72032 RepID=A0A0F4ZK71_9PEZI|nr:hypothetical protein TD95_004640 [Thielaviopsis punctulata]
MPLHPSPPSGPSSLAESLRYNLHTLRAAPFAEISGALGDLGTFLPLTLALAAHGAISLGPTLFFSGLFNFLTGAIFGLPLPVQPMKSLAAAALAQPHHPAPDLAAAGLLLAATLFVLAASHLVPRAARAVPVPVVKGIQLSAGLGLASGAASLLHALSWTQPLWDNRLCALAVFLGVLATHGRRAPLALVVFGAAAAAAVTHAPTPLLPGLWTPQLLRPRASWRALDMALGQLPLTLLNSVVAVDALSGEAVPRRPRPGVGPLAWSVAGMNAVGPWVGCMPVCHGSGGLAAQVRFGARSGAAVMVLGAMKMVLGLVWGESLGGVMAAFPRSVLGVMVVAAGVELAGAGMSLNHGATDLVEVAANGECVVRAVGEEERRQRWTVMMMTVGAGMACKSTAVGFAAGMLCDASYRVVPRVLEWWDRQPHIGNWCAQTLWRSPERQPLL